MRYIALILALFVFPLLFALTDNEKLLFAELQKTVPNINVIKGLVSKPDVTSKAKDNDGNTPLHYAVQSGVDHVINFLLDNGADVLATNNDGQVALTYGLKKSIRGLSQALIDKLSNPLKNALRQEWEAAGTYGSFSKSNAYSREVFQKLKQRKKAGETAIFEIPDQDGYPVIYWAIHYNDPAMVQLLLDEGVQELITKNTTGAHQPVLHAAVYKAFSASQNDKEVKVIKNLVKAGADIHLKDRSERTAYQYLRSLESFGHVSSWQVYLEGGTPLHWAAAMGESESKIKQIIKEHPDYLNKPSSLTKRTPLVTALYYKQPLVASALLENGADPNISDDTGNNALFYLVNDITAGKNINILTLILEKYPTIIEAQNSFGETMLLKVLHEGIFKLVPLFLTSNTVNKADRFGTTPLSKLLEKTRYWQDLDEVSKVLKSLVEEGSNLSFAHGALILRKLIDISGRLQTAKRTDDAKKVKEEFIPYVLSKGANPDLMVDYEFLDMRVPKNLSARQHWEYVYKNEPFPSSTDALLGVKLKNLEVSLRTLARYL